MALFEQRLRQAIQLVTACWTRVQTPARLVFSDSKISFPV